MTIRIGINPITWTNDDVPELGGDTPLETCLAETGEAGYTGIELGGKFPRQSSDLTEILSRHRLALIAGWWDGRMLEASVDQEFDRLLPHLTLLRDVGARYVVYADTSGGRHDAIWRPISDRPTIDDADWPAYGAKLTELAGRMADFGVKMAFHHHMGTVIETDAETDRLMSVTGDAVGLLFDSGHSAFSGGDPLSLLRRNITRVVHVHCKDARADKLARARAEDSSFMDAVLDGIFTVPGDGCIDFPAILSVLHDADYAGWLVVEAEQDPRKADPLSYARLGYRNVLGMARQAGFEVIEREADQ